MEKKNFPFAPDLTKPIALQKQHGILCMKDEPHTARFTVTRTYYNRYHGEAEPCPRGSTQGRRYAETSL
jgi:hypothetical protein